MGNTPKCGLGLGPWTLDLGLGVSGRFLNLGLGALRLRAVLAIVMVCRMSMREPPSQGNCRKDLSRGGQ